MKRLLVLLAALLPMAAAAQSPCTVKEEMDRIGEAFGVYFVYDASLPVDGLTYFRVDPQKSLQKNLRELFDDSDIVWRVKNQYVVLAMNPVELRLAPVWPDPEPVAVMDTLVEAVKTAQKRCADLPSGSYPIDPLLVRQVVNPTGESDALKYVQTLPGVSMGGEGTTALFVRGGNMGSNAFTLDGVPIYGISHLMGLTSVFPGDVIGTSEFQVGGFSADAGNFTSSHIRLQSYSGDFERARARFSVNPFLVSASVSTPMEKGKSSFLGSVRVSPIGLEYKAFKKMVDSRQNSFEDFGASIGDFYGKFTWRPDSRNEIALSFFGTLDDNRFTLDDRTTETMRWSNAVAILSWNKQRALCFDSVRTSVSLNDHVWAQLHMENTWTSNDWYVRDHVINRLDELMLQSSGFKKWGRLSLETGVQLRAARFNQGTRLYSVRNNEYVHRETLESQMDNVSHVLNYAVHGELGYVIPETFLLKLALRGNYYSLMEQVLDITETDHSVHSFLPEASMAIRFHFIPQLGMEGTVDYRSQFYHYLEEMSFGWTLDPIVPSNSIIPPERALQGYCGLFGGFGTHMFRAGGFYKKMYDIIFYKNTTNFYNAEALSWKVDTRIGDGASYGAELYYSKTGRDLSWQFSYTWSKSDRSNFRYMGKDGHFPAKYDRRHMLHADIRWKGLTAAFTLQSGHHETITALKYSLFYREWDFDHLLTRGYILYPFNWQVPTYIRFDLGYQLSFCSGKDRAHPLNHKLTIGIYNLLNRHNASMLRFDNESEQWLLLSFFPIMPSVSYSLEL